MKHQTRISRGGPRTALGLALALWGLVWAAAGPAAVSGAAPSAQGTAEPEPPPRTSLGPAPERQPVDLGPRQLAGDVTGTLLELPAVADAYIASNRPTQNFGGGALFLGYNEAGDNFGAQRMLLRFDLSSLPENAVILDARLRLYLIYADPAGDTAMGTIVRRVASAWGEHTVTWNTEPTWASVRDESSVGTDAGWYEWNITDLATAWAQDDLANHGVEVIGDENAQQRERAFYSRETTTELFPRLAVFYTVVVDDLPPTVTVEALPAYSGRNFVVQWSGSDQGEAGLHHYDVQYQVDGGAWVNWHTNVTFTSAEFTGAANGHTYAFRARGVDNVGNTEAYGGAEAQTLVDTQPPTSTLTALPGLTNAATFTVTWQGADNASGVQYYDVRYRYNRGNWLAWQTNTVATSAQFTAMLDGLYEFEVRAVDRAGQAEIFTGTPGAATLVDVEAPFVVPRVYMPVVYDAE